MGIIRRLMAKNTNMLKTTHFDLRRKEKNNFLSEHSIKVENEGCFFVVTAFGKKRINTQIHLQIRIFTLLSTGRGSHPCPAESGSSQESVAN